MESTVFDLSINYEAELVLSLGVSETNLVRLAISKVGGTLNDTNPSNVEAESSISQEKHLALTLVTTTFPFGTPFGWEGMGKESTVWCFGLDLGQDLEVLGSVKLDWSKFLDDGSVVAVHGVLGLLGVGSTLVGFDLLLGHLFILFLNFDLSDILFGHCFGSCDDIGGSLYLFLFKCISGGVFSVDNGGLRLELGFDHDSIIVLGLGCGQSCVLCAVRGLRYNSCGDLASDQGFLGSKLSIQSGHCCDTPG